MQSDECRRNFSRFCLCRACGLKRRHPRHLCTGQALSKEPRQNKKPARQIPERALILKDYIFKQPQPNHPIYRLVLPTGTGTRPEDCPLGANATSRAHRAGSRLRTNLPSLSSKESAQNSQTFGSYIIHDASVAISVEHAGYEIHGWVVGTSLRRN